jgi:tetratricopeptide (TPR) repeat protein
MILTLCTACAAPLPEDDAVQCAACATRYCGDRCERYDRRRGGHGKICGAVASGGGAEQYHADKKYEEAVADAVEECAEDTEGQTCYICLEGGSEEGLVRMCACRGAAGFAHVSCLARQAKVLIEEAEERDLDGDAFDARWDRWDTCRLCEQEYHGPVICALGWACWKTYVGRPEADETLGRAMTTLGNGLHGAGHYEDALVVLEAELAVLRRIGGSESTILVVQCNLAGTYGELGDLEKALSMERDIYSGELKLCGEENERTLISANNLAVTLNDLKRFEEAKSLLRKTMPVARRVLGEGNDVMLKMRWAYARVLYEDPAATLDDLREAVTTLEDTERTARRVLGGTHPDVVEIEERLRDARDALRARETPSPSPSESS